MMEKGERQNKDISRRIKSYSIQRTVGVDIVVGPRKRPHPQFMEKNFPVTPGRIGLVINNEIE